MLEEKKRRKKFSKQECRWCGTNMRGRSVCPRGPFCAKQEAEHYRLCKLAGISGEI